MGAEGALIGFGTLATALQVEMYELTARGALGRGARDLGADPAARGGRLRPAGARLPGPDEGRAASELGVIESTRHAPAAPAGRPRTPTADPRRARRGRPVRGLADGRRPRRPGRAGHRQQPRHRRGGRGQGAAEGATVAVHYNTRADEAAAGRWRGSARPVRRATHSRADVSDGAQARAARRRGSSTSFGRLDGLVNNAGLTQVGPFLDDQAERVGRRHRDGPDGRVPHVPGRHPAHARAGRRVDRQRRVAPGPDGDRARRRPTARPRPG